MGMSNAERQARWRERRDQRHAKFIAKLEQLVVKETARARKARRGMKYAIRCTPGGLLRDDATFEVISFASYNAAEAEALRLTQAAYTNPRVAGFDFTPIEMPETDPLLLAKGAIEEAAQRLLRGPDSRQSRDK
jgi:hypothetical protein